MGIEPGDLSDAARRKVEEARVRLSDAAVRVSHEAISAGSTISALVLDALDRRGNDLSDRLQHVADGLREMAGADDGASPGMVRQAVDLIDDLSRRLRHPSARDLRGKIARFGRDNPATFIAACLATGALTGRFLIAQSEGTDRRTPLHRPTREEAWRGNAQAEDRQPAPAAGPHEAARSGPDLLPGDGPGARPGPATQTARDATGEPGRGTRHG